VPIGEPKSFIVKRPTLHEVKKMKGLKGWPFEPLDGDVKPCGGDGAGPGNTH